MDVPAVLSVSQEPLHHKNNEPAANKETNTSRSIITNLYWSVLVAQHCQTLETLDSEA